MSHLYVMQNHLGLVKIGYSSTVEVRLKKIEYTHGCKAALVAVARNAGHREEAVHSALDDYRLVGEWFDGTDEAREAIIAAIGLKPSTSWPVALADHDRVEEWLSDLDVRMWRTSRDKAIQQVIREMITRGPSADSSRWDDAKLFTAYWRFACGQRGTVIVGGRGSSETKYTGLVSDDHRCFARVPVPHYSTNVAAALSLWPDHDRPVLWEGSAWDCCIAALKALKACA